MNEYQAWTGKKVNKNGVVYIETDERDWFNRVRIWQHYYQRDENTTCPCPMPKGHLMFRGKRKER